MGPGYGEYFSYKRRVMSHERDSSDGLETSLEAGGKSDSRQGSTSFQLPMFLCWAIKS